MKTNPLLSLREAADKFDSLSKELAETAKDTPDLRAKIALESLKEQADSGKRFALFLIKRLQADIKLDGAALKSL